MGSFLGGGGCPVKGGRGLCPACPDEGGGRGEGGSVHPVPCHLPLQ
jgi:hypothetical protein